MTTGSEPKPAIAGLATAVPPHVLRQQDARAFARGLFRDVFRDVDRLLTVFEHGGIEKRHIAQPLAWFERPHTFAEKNAVYRDAALTLSQRAATEAMATAGVTPSDIGGLVFVSSTGISTPSLDSVLIPALSLPRTIARLPVWGLGCAGGGAGLGHAAALCQGLSRPVLLIAVELCSATFVHGDRSKSNFVATSLFGDGAAAAVITPHGPGPTIVGRHSQLFDDTQDVMGWNLVEAGLQVRFARSIPKIVTDHLPGIVRHAAAEAGVDAEAFEHFAVHPGGAKVMDAYERSLGLGPDDLSAAIGVLREYGNMSSPTVLFVLDRLLRERPARGAPGFLVGFGPGFCAEGIVFRW